MLIIIILVVLVITMTLMSISLFLFCEKWESFACFVFGCFSAAIALIMAAIIPFISFNYVAAKYQAKIINQEYGKNYSREEIFFAKNAIETIRQLDRSRFEINGNILEEKK
jgi:ABC-type transport system involved in multi-copper enzyme maturation permease subunit